MMLRLPDPRRSLSAFALCAALFALLPAGGGATTSLGGVASCHWVSKARALALVEPYYPAPTVTTENDQCWIHTGPKVGPLGGTYPISGIHAGAAEKYRPFSFEPYVLRSLARPAPHGCRISHPSRVNDDTYYFVNICPTVSNGPPPAFSTQGVVLRRPGNLVTTVIDTFQDNGKHLPRAVFVKVVTLLRWSCDTPCVVNPAPQ